MTQYSVEMRGEGREVYIVEAESAEEARANWFDGFLQVSEIYGCEVYAVTKDDE